MPQGQYRVRQQSERARRPSEDRARREHGGYIESPKKLAKAYEEAFERNKLKLAEQREELRRLAKARHSR
jgi:hypothetical protein